MSNQKPFNLEDRTFEFARDCHFLIKNLSKTISNIEDAKQLVRASGSVGANYIEGNEKPGEKDLKYRIKISRKEAKESEYWLKLLKSQNPSHSNDIEKLIIEAAEIRKILSTIINKLDG
ncbi:four helix bundle protein [Seonamhaeicola sp. S2-3]|uniref:four helix bundle protein n=1 Tax=Seonamhaeicola sp. S2-3 TaxID=1936081 RepID=UPI0012F765CC|nr:four helix bundle protein [Seonamhaeicola sp. S2-3]